MAFGLPDFTFFFFPMIVYYSVGNGFHLLKNNYIDGVRFRYISYRIIAGHLVPAINYYDMKGIFLQSV